MSQFKTSENVWVTKDVEIGLVTQEALTTVTCTIKKGTVGKVLSRLDPRSNCSNDFVSGYSVEFLLSNHLKVTTVIEEINLRRWDG